MSTAKLLMPEPDQPNDEKWLIQLLEQHASLMEQLERFPQPVVKPKDQAAVASLKQQIKKLEDEIIALVDEHFRDALKPVLIKVFGKGVVNPQGDVSVRYTSVVNDFFTKVLADRDDAFWRAKTAKKLRSWASVVMRNQVLDHIRRKKRFPQTVDDIGAFADQRQVHFEKYNEVPFEQALATLECWKEGTDDEKVMALVLQHRYIDGMKYDEIADQLDLEKEQLYRIAETAKKQLREKCQESGR